MTRAVDIWKEQNHFQQDAITGSAMLRDTILRLWEHPLPITWFDPVGVSPRLRVVGKTPIKRHAPKRPAPKQRAVVKKRGRPALPFRINPEIERIKAAVADHFQIDRQWMTWHCNAWSVAHPRMIAMYLARHLERASYPNIGKHFNRDHTTILLACRSVAQKEKFFNDVKELTEKLRRENAIEQTVKTQARIAA